VERSGEKHSEAFFRWRAKGIAGNGLAVDHEYTLWMPARIQIGTSSRPTMASGRYLAIGWTAPRGKALPSKVYVAVEVLGGRAKPSIDGTGQGDVFLLGLFPTTENSVPKGEGMALRSMAQTLVSSNDAWEIRDLSAVLAGVRADPPPFDMLEGEPCDRWLDETLTPILSKADLSMPLRRLRLGGLEVRNSDASVRLAFWKRVPSMLKALEPGDPADVYFLADLDLMRGQSADDVLPVAFAMPSLLYMALHGQTQKPGIAIQRRLLGYLDSQGPGLRASIYCEFAHWYGEYDRMTRSYLPAEASSARGEVVENEEALRKYWTEKIGGGAAP
jgi:hypothetical protein